MRKKGLRTWVSRFNRLITLPLAAVMFVTTMLSHIGSYIQSQQDTSLRTDMASLEGKQPYETPSFSLFIGEAHAGIEPPSVADF
ncbi:MAG: hypothetical protein AB7F82_08305 [Alphaproteobacteria bacterium]